MTEPGAAAAKPGHPKDGYLLVTIVDRRSGLTVARVDEPAAYLRQTYDHGFGSFPYQPKLEPCCRRGDLVLYPNEKGLPAVRYGLQAEIVKWDDTVGTEDGE